MSLDTVLHLNNTLAQVNNVWNAPSLSQEDGLLCQIGSMG